MIIRCISRHTRRLAWLFILLCGASALIPNTALAAGPACSAPAQTTIQLGNVSISPDTPNGPIQGALAYAYITFDCSNVFEQHPKWENQTIQVHGLAARVSGMAPPASTLLFQTSVPGIAVALQATPTPPSDGPNGPGGSPGWELGSMCPDGNEFHHVTCNTTEKALTASFTAQLYKIGPVTPGTFQITPLLRFTNYGYGYSDSANDYASLNIGQVTISAPSCTVATDPTIVTLPTIVSSALTGQGSTTGQQSFHIELSCSNPDQRLKITLDSNHKAGPAGVIDSTATNNAHGVGVQLLSGNSCSHVVHFGTSINEGHTPQGTMNLPFCARYYQTGATVTGGNVKAVATYTLDYQ